MKKLPQLEAVAVQFLCVQVDTEAAHTLLRCTWYRTTIMECESMEPGPAWSTRTIVGPEQTGPAPQPGIHARLGTLSCANTGRYMDIKCVKVLWAFSPGCHAWHQPYNLVTLQPPKQRPLGCRVDPGCFGLKLFPLHSAEHRVLHGKRVWTSPHGRGPLAEKQRL